MLWVEGLPIYMPDSPLRLIFRTFHLWFLSFLTFDCPSDSLLVQLCLFYDFLFKYIIDICDLVSACTFKKI